MTPSPTTTKRTAMIMGASSGVGRALGETLAKKGYALVLAARGQRDLEAVASDLRLRFGADVFVEPIDLSADPFTAESLLKACRNHLGQLDALFFPAGMVDDADTASGAVNAIDRLTRTNYLSVVKLCMLALENRLLKSPSTIVVFSSIAAAAPRKRNAAYGAAKAALEYYAKALRHELAGTQIFVQVYGLGYVDTSMSFGKPLLFPLATVDNVASHVVSRLNKDTGMSYFPRFWRLVVSALAILPWSLYKRLNF